MPCGSRASSCSVASPAIPRESCATELCRLELDDLRGEQQRDPRGDTDDREALLHQRARRRTRYRCRTLAASRLAARDAAVAAAAPAAGLGSSSCRESSRRAARDTIGVGGRHRVVADDHGRDAGARGTAPAAARALRARAGCRGSRRLVGEQQARLRWRARGRSSRAGARPSRASLSDGACAPPARDARAAARPRAGPRASACSSAASAWRCRSR